MNSNEVIQDFSAWVKEPSDPEKYWAMLSAEDLKAMHDALLRREVSTNS